MADHVLITGASSGIGAALARELCSRGYSVGLLARREKELAQLCSELVAQGGQAAMACADVCDREELAAAVRTLEAALGPTAVLVANAGVAGALRPARGWDADALRRSMEVNYFGAAHAVEATLAGMLARERGLLVVVSSVASARGLPGSGPYSASKAAISTLWESLRVDLRGTGVDCLTVHPGFVATPMTAESKLNMPFLMGPERAAALIAGAIDSRSSTLTFPWQMALAEWLMARLPNWLFDRLVSGRN